MRSRSRVETEIAARLSRLSDVDMQRVAEDYAQIRYPQRFPRWDFRAFSMEGKSRFGWPDAWIVKSGRVDGVEATSNKSKSGVVQHLQKDLEKAIAQEPPLAGLIVVSGSPEVTFTPDEIAHWQERFVSDAGIPAESFELVLGPELISRLARPEFARTRREILRVFDAPSRFEPIHAQLSPGERHLSRNIVPTAADYAAGRIHRPAAADDVVTKLAQAGIALIRGSAASGKTVLGWLLGLEADRNNRSAYYFNLDSDGGFDPSLEPALREDIANFSYPGSLFILDNCHLAERLTQNIVMAWRGMRSEERPQLLLLARELRISQRSMLDGLNLPIIKLRAGQAELRGVYERIMARHSPGLEIPIPPITVLDDWLRTFAAKRDTADGSADLIVFSAAVQGGIDGLRSRDWYLSEDHAVEDMRRRYLRRIKPPEQSNLLRLCYLSAIELALDYMSLVHASDALDTCTEELAIVGVSELKTRSRKVLRYRLDHPARAKLLLLAANCDPKDSQHEFEGIMRQHPNAGAAIVQRLLVLGEIERASALIRFFAETPKCFEKIDAVWFQNIATAAHRLDAQLSALIAQNLALPETLRGFARELVEQTSLSDKSTCLKSLCRIEGFKPVIAKLAREIRERFADPFLLGEVHGIASAPVHFIVDLLKASQRCEELTPLTTLIGENANAISARIVQTILGWGGQPETPLHFLKVFLEFSAQNQELHTLHQSIIAALENSPHTRTALQSSARRGELGDLLTFLEYSIHADAQLRHLSLDLISDLCESANIAVLVAQASGSALEAREKIPLASLLIVERFLKSTSNDPDLRPLYRSFTKTLSDAHHCERLSKRMLDDNLGNVGSFLSFAETAPRLKLVHRAMVAQLREPQNLPALARAALKTPLHFVDKFLMFLHKREPLLPVFTALIDTLAEDQHCRELSFAVEREPINNLVGIFKNPMTGDLWQAVVRRISTDRWTETRLAEANAKPNAFRAFRAAAASVQRSELAEAPARRLVKGSTSAEWSQPVVRLGHLAEVIECATGAAVADIEDFLQRILTEEVLRNLVGMKSALELADALFGLAANLSPEHLERFRCDPLQHRLAAEWLHAASPILAEQRVALTLCGAAAAAEIRIESGVYGRIASNDIFEFLDPKSGFRYREPQFRRLGALCLGLREAVRSGMACDPLSPRVGEALLNYWRAACQRRAPRIGRSSVYQRHRGVIDWLNLCRIAGWRLLSPDDDSGTSGDPTS